MNAPEEIFAHSKKNAPRKEWQTLEAHSRAVAVMAAEFAGGFNSGAFAAILGALHDIGKARGSFQGYLARANGLSDADYDAGEHGHSGAGACWAAKRGFKNAFGKVLAYCIAGHHAGLPDWMNGVNPNGALDNRLKTECPVLEEKPVARWIAAHEAEWKVRAPKTNPWNFKASCKEKQFENSDLSFWIRMLYSCLVDADFLDTETVMEPTGKKSVARGKYPSLKELAPVFFERLYEKEAAAPDTGVNRLRKQIRIACEQAAEKPPGIFTLTVPTGGGKTLSGTAFALRHALRHGKKRIIYVIPYTSIIEQTANTLRESLGDGNVLEHHSNFDPKKKTLQSDLASENWDASVIVTTSVQFFESLYACRSSRCRKLHNIAGSVVILDEVQLLPTHLLLPCIEAIRQLADHYGVTFVLSTATQPALPGLRQDPGREIIPPSMDLYSKLKRVEIEWPPDMDERREWEDLAKELGGYEQVLCIVNTRRDCRKLYDLMPKGKEEGVNRETFHLSTLMCGEHRSRVINDIKKQLRDIKEGRAPRRPVRVISTQLVEAGVDIDFPVVYRAFTGLASIAQAAGRCNREGGPTPGKVVVFMPPTPSPQGSLLKAENTLKDILSNTPDMTDEMNSPTGFTRYFQELYGRMNELGEEFRDFFIKGAPRCEFQFREGAEKFRMIEDEATRAVIVRYGKNDDLIERLRLAGPRREIMRGLQRYTVSVPCGSITKLLEKGFVEEMHPGVFVQTMPSLYTETFGFDLYREGFLADELMT